MEVSVIIPIYNSEQFILGMLNQLSSQIFKRVEFLLIDDGSTDSTASIITKFISKHDDPRFYFYRKENSGVSSTRNFGIKKAVGKYLIFVDSDDFFDKYFVENYYTHIEKSKADMEFFAIGSVDEKNQLIKKIYTNKLYKKYSNSLESLNDIFEFRIQGYPFGYISKRELWVQGFPNEIRIAEDLYALTALLNNNSNLVIHYTDSAYYHYALRSDSTLRSADTRADWEGIQTTGKIQELFDNNPYLKKKSRNLQVGLFFEFLKKAAKNNNLKEYRKYRKLIFTSFINTSMPIKSRIRRILIIMLTISPTPKLLRIFFRLTEPS